MEGNRWLYLSVGVTEEFRDVCMSAYDLQCALDVAISEWGVSEGELIQQIIALNSKLELFLYSYTQFIRRANFSDELEEEKKRVEEKVEGDLNRLREFLKSSISIYGKKGTTIIPYLTTVEQALSMVYIMLTNLKIEWHKAIEYAGEREDITPLLINLNSLFNTALTFNLLSYLSNVYDYLDKIYSSFSGEGRQLMIQFVKTNFPNLQEFYVEYAERYNVEENAPFYSSELGEVVDDSVTSLNSQIEQSISNLGSPVQLTRGMFGFTDEDKEALYRKMPDSLKLIMGTITEPEKLRFKEKPIEVEGLTEEDMNMLAEEEDKKKKK